MKIVATTSLPAVDRPNADRWNAARSRQFNLARESLGNQEILNTRPRDREKEGGIQI